jgi:glycosyltransferase involved in cell wall biosynthesis
MISCSLIISTYNWPSALALCLQSLLQLTVLPDEVIIADDGSHNETKNLVEQFKQVSPIPIKHIWHEDQGFRLAKIRNKAIANAKGDYIIQIDGDVIMEPHFIQDHLRLSKPDYFVIGSRGSLNRRFSQSVLSSQKIPPINLLRKNCSGVLNTFRNKFLSNFLSDKYKVNGKHKYYSKGCNMAFWRKDFNAVNGYNEIMEGWGREDEELVSRLYMLGLKKQFLKMGGVVFHIWHKKAAHQNEPHNLKILFATRAAGKYRAELGLDQY